MEAFLLSAGIVALAEMGDKTQLLSFVLAARFRRPLPIILGVLVECLTGDVVLKPDVHVFHPGCGV